LEFGIWNLEPGTPEPGTKCVAPKYLQDAG
jgi:hypothetical protein